MVSVGTIDAPLEQCQYLYTLEWINPKPDVIVEELVAAINPGS
ncbi:MAG: hypothetical protein SFY80_02035 [Verrucomicrobiota bacterium]|nr:hypothetical protein [Verrucomicrobiota bacterium]